MSLHRAVGARTLHLSGASDAHSLARRRRRRHHHPHTRTSPLDTTTPTQKVFKYVLHYLRARASASDTVYLPTDETTRALLVAEARYYMLPDLEVLLEDPAYAPGGAGASAASFQQQVRGGSFFVFVGGRGEQGFARHVRAITDDDFFLRIRKTSND